MTQHFATTRSESMQQGTFTHGVMVAMIILNASSTGNVVTITNTDGCSSVDSVYVTIATPLTVTMIRLTLCCFSRWDGFCNSYRGNRPHSYLWNDANAQNTAIATNLSSGTYTVSVTDNNNCGTTGIISIAEPTLLTASVLAPENIPDFTFAGVYNNQYIYYHTAPLSWTDARAKAHANNGDLVIARNADDTPILQV